MKPLFPKIKIILKIAETNDARYSGLFIAKLSSSIGLMPLFALKSPFNSYSKFTKPGSSSPFPLTLNVAFEPFLPTLNIFLKLLNGINICLSNESPAPKDSPCSLVTPIIV